MVGRRKKVSMEPPQYNGGLWGPSKARVTCHVQHMGKDQADSKYDLNMESFLTFKKSTVKHIPRPP
jgi:hypothetical protein